MTAHKDLKRIIREPLVIERRWTWREDAYASGRIENPRIDVEGVRACWDPAGTMFATAVPGRRCPRMKSVKRRRTRRGVPR